MESQCEQESKQATPGITSKWSIHWNFRWRALESQISPEAVVGNCNRGNIAFLKEILMSVLNDYYQHVINMG